MEATHIPIKVTQSSRTVRITGIRMCIGVVMTSSEPGRREIVAGHFVTPEMFDEANALLNDEGTKFVDRIKELTRELISDGIKYNVKFYVNDVEKDESTANAVEKLKEEFGRLSDEEIEVKNALGGVVSVLVPAKAWVSRTRQERLRKAAEEGGGVTTETPREET